MQVKFFGGPIDGGAGHLDVRPEDAPEVLLFPDDDEWGLWSGPSVAYELIGAHQVNALGHWEAHYTQQVSRA